MSESFWVIPAIDLMGGAVVRLRQGRFDEATRYARDPVGWAQALVEAGARRLHVVDLDGARQGQPVHLGLLRRIAGAAGVPVQFGGGLRSLEAVEAALDAGAAAVMLGTAALDADFMAQALGRYGPERIWAAIDVRAGRVVVAGWEKATGEAPGAVARRLAGLGVKWALVTDAASDGTLAGTDPEAALAVARGGLRVIAAGGIGSAEDVARLARLGLAGAVIGRALYEGRLTLPQAMAAAAAAAGGREHGAGVPDHPLP